MNPTLDRSRHYQTMVNGEPVRLDKLTLDQAIEALIDAYDLIEKMEVAADEIGLAIEAWRGK